MLLYMKVMYYICTNKKIGIMNIKEWIEETYTGNRYEIRNRIVCNDGFYMSVQGGYGYYCSPRTESKYYKSMEIGFPSEEEPLIFEYAENKDDYTQTVYGWVPVEIIQEVIDKHGGINIEQTFKTK